MSTIPVSISEYAPQSLYEKVCLKSIEQMTEGKLSITLPNGDIYTQGKDNANFEADIHIHQDICFKKIVLFGDIGFGDAYVEGLWDTSNITNFIKWVLLNIKHSPTLSGSNLKNKLGLNLLSAMNKVSHYFRKNSEEGSKKNIVEHYDLGNDFYSLWLDESMTYSSAYFTDENTPLHEAQFEKYDRLCRKLRLSENDHVLEIGTGWGGMAIHMAQQYGCKVTTATISDEQFKLASNRVKEQGLESQVTVVLSDYRKLEGTFDKIVSIEMIEAVGHQFLPVYFKTINRLLKPQGILALQAITCPDSRYNELRKGVDWIQKHIFPGSLLPSVGQINKVLNQTSDLTMMHLEDFGLHYAKTLQLWFNNFNEKLEEVKQMGFSDAFIRKWNYYLCYCEAAFEMRNINVMHLIYARPNNLVI